MSMRLENQGRPRVQIDRSQFEKLCFLQCTLEEIAGFFGCSKETVRHWCITTYNMNWKDVYNDKAGQGKIALRRSLQQMSEHDSKVAIFLAKNLLGMSDRQQIEVSHSDDTTKAMDDFFEEKEKEAAQNGCDTGTNP